MRQRSAELNLGGQCSKELRRMPVRQRNKELAGGRQGGEAMELRNTRRTSKSSTHSRRRMQKGAVKTGREVT